MAYVATLKQQVLLSLLLLLTLHLVFEEPIYLYGSDSTGYFCAYMVSHLELPVKCC
jgi:hypothetical protein